MGVLVMGRSDVGWRMQLAMWLERRSNSDRALMRTLTEVIIENSTAFSHSTIVINEYILDVRGEHCTVLGGHESFGDVWWTE